jgi:hypothetical protein
LSERCGDLRTPLSRMISQRRDYHFAAASQEMPRAAALRLAPERSRGGKGSGAGEE